MSDGGLTPEGAGKLLQAELANVVKLLKAGKTLTNQQRALLASIKNGETDPSEAEGVKTKLKLAQALGISRTTLDGYIKSPNFPAKHPTNGWDLIACRGYVDRLRAGRATNPDIKRGDPEAMGERAGAEFALARLAKAELQAYSDWWSAYESNDAESADISLKAWLSLTGPLREYERIIDKDKRDAGEVMSRTEIVGFLMMIGQCISYAEESYLDRQAIVITELKDPTNAREVRQTSKDLLYNKMAEMLDLGCEQEKYPIWMAEALAEGMRPVLKERPEPKEEEA